MVFTSGGELVEERRRARWVGGSSSWEDAMVRLM
jgi:hypothetical protein